MDLTIYLSLVLNQLALALQTMNAMISDETNATMTQALYLIVGLCSLCFSCMSLLICCAKLYQGCSETGLLNCDCLDPYLEPLFFGSSNKDYTEASSEKTNLLDPKKEEEALTSPSRTENSVFPTPSVEVPYSI